MLSEEPDVIGYIKMPAVRALVSRADFWITDFFACDKFTLPTGQEGKMRIRSIGICDKDIDYASNLMDGINRIGEGEFSACAFSDIQCLLEFVKKEDPDILLTSDRVDGARCVLLTDDEEMRHRDVSQTGELYKYQSVKEIVCEIRKLFKPAEISVRKRCRFIAVYSPLGRCGKTNLAKALAAQDEVRGGLYVSMENFTSENSDADILYLLKQRSPDLSAALGNSIFQESDFSVLYASGAYIDTHDVLGTDVELLNRELDRLGRFSTVCYDIGSCAFTDFSIFNQFDLIYFPVLEDEVSMRKLKGFRQLVYSMGMLEKFSRCIEIKVPDCGYGSPEMTKAIWQAGRYE